MRNPLFLVYVLAGLTALAPFAIDTYLPAFPALEHDFAASTIEVQHSLTFYLLPYALMTLFHGAISDAIGRIATIRWGLGIFTLASIGCMLAPNVETLWVMRIVQGLSAGAGNVVARAMVRDLYQGVEAQRVMATIQMLFAIAPAVAPVIGGWLLGIHWQAIFGFLALYSAIMLWAASRFLPETVPQEKRSPLSFRNVYRNYRTIFTHREYSVLVLATGANFSAFFLYVLASPVFLIEHLGLSSQQFAWMFIPTVCGTILGSWLAKRAAGRYGTRQILWCAYAWMALMAVCNLLVSALPFMHPALNILPIALFNIGMALAMPVLSVSALDCHPRIRGTAASGQAFMQMLLSTISAGLVAPLVWHHPAGLALTMLGFLLLGWLAVRRSQLLLHRQE
ncbi:MFS transporter, DHA1 family, bicyclomycin/chloramphenicol resistance protein [Methylobacillus rhizosphaerae]|uniref:Bcr/CflA family efflux transporter n=1 Tax=Methylobacillus rhizosphaerae TaxID=551994 RepID=A0A238YHZ8_9PROT|nr:multidrug effflux MFS transporter [Methylobacillus rhizosphaerae]SNR70825.1 MFS transporter, DHA1 family, bicyclomycin/chloramphenicol resistance protein [Methylobacillus rhizosphaerae]